MFPSYFIGVRKAAWLFFFLVPEFLGSELINSAGRLGPHVPYMLEDSRGNILPVYSNLVSCSNEKSLVVWADFVWHKDSCWCEFIATLCDFFHYKIDGLALICELD